MHPNASGVLLFTEIVGLAPCGRNNSERNYGERIDDNRDKGIENEYYGIRLKQYVVSCVDA